MTRRLIIGLASGLVACIALVSSIVVMTMLVGEDWCADRSPWWGPPENPDSTCSGLAWASRHPGDYPWAMPR